MSGPSRNVVLGSWTQEELERLFGEELPDIDLIAGYVADNPAPTATEAGSSRYAVEDFTESHPLEGEEYVPSTQMPETAPREVPPRRSSIQPDVGAGAGSSRGGTSSASTAHTSGHTQLSGGNEGPSSSARKKKKLTSPVWEDFIVSFSTNADGSEERWGRANNAARRYKQRKKRTERMH